MQKKTQWRRRHGPLRKNPERTAFTFHYQRALREQALDQVRAGDEWVSVADIIDQVALQKGLAFNSTARSDLSEEICLEIETDISENRLMGEDVHGLMLLSNEYSETTLTSTNLIKSLYIGFDGLDKANYRKSLVQFLRDHCWIKRSIVEPWLTAKGYKLRPHPRPAQKLVAATAERETACRKWLIGQMESNREKPQSRDEYAAQAEAKFGVGPRAFKRAWDKAVDATKRFNWKNAGRPKKSKH